jgi:hypothetical protein
MGNLTSEECKAPWHRKDWNPSKYKKPSFKKTEVKEEKE